MSKKNYSDLEDEEYDQLDKFSKMRQPPGRKKSKNQSTEKEFELSEDDWNDEKFKGCFAARVVETHKKYCFVAPESKIGDVDSRDVYLATIARKYLLAQKKQRNFVSVGDRVLCSKDVDTGVQTDIPQCVVQHISPRRNLIRRLDPHNHHMSHTIATNIDQLIIVASYLNPEVRWGLIDRYLALAEIQRVPAALILNKVDLLKADGDSVTEEFVTQSNAHAKLIENLGYKVLSIQANSKRNLKKSDQLEKIRELTAGKISLVVGHSGVGKSSFVNLLNPELVQMVEKDSNIFYKGRHTTSFASFLKLGNGGFLIDTPGVRSFLLSPEDIDQLEHGFAEIGRFAGKCQFAKCQHLGEEGCSVQAAVEAGTVSPERLKSYQQIKRGTSMREGRFDLKA